MRDKQYLTPGSRINAVCNLELQGDMTWKVDGFTGDEAYLLDDTWNETPVAGCSEVPEINKPYIDEVDYLNEEE